jgi:hypothetical protein
MTATVATPTPTDARATRTLALVSATAAAAFTLAVVVAGLLDPGYSQTGEGISALASVESRSAGVMIIGFVCLALTTLAVGTALWLTPE